MKLTHQARFERPPQKSRAKVRPVTSGQEHVGCILTGMDLIRTANGNCAALNPQMLLNNLELQEMRRLNTGDALYQIPVRVNAADHCPNAGLLAFGSNRMRKQRTKKERRLSGNLLIQHDVIPEHFRAGVQVNPCCHRFTYGYTGEQPTHEPIQPF